VSTRAARDLGHKSTIAGEDTGGLTAEKNRLPWSGEPGPRSKSLKVWWPEEERQRPWKRSDKETSLPRGLPNDVRDDQGSLPEGSSRPWRAWEKRSGLADLGNNGRAGRVALGQTNIQPKKVVPNFAGKSRGCKPPKTAGPRNEPGVGMKGKATPDRKPTPMKKPAAERIEHKKGRINVQTFTKCPTSAGFGNWRGGVYAHEISGR